MYLYLKKCDTICYKNTMAVFGFVVTAFLFGQPKLARSAVFEQFDNGTVVYMDSGVSEDTPLLHPQDDKSFRSDAIDGLGPAEAKLTGFSTERSPLVQRFAGVVFDIPVSDGLGATTFTVQSARQMRRLSPQQRQMRMLTAEVGLAFARRPGVIRAKLNEEDFVDFFTTMIQRESNFQVNAVSRAGAIGLGQLMPATARALGVCNAFSARENLEGSAHYLTSMLDQFGSQRLALAAYNAGPGAVKKYGGIPPYRETRRYVSDIMNTLNRKTSQDYRIVSIKSQQTTTGGAPSLSVVSASFKMNVVPAKHSAGCDLSDPLNKQIQYAYN